MSPLSGLKAGGRRESLSPYGSLVNGTILPH